MPLAELIARVLVLNVPSYWHLVHVSRTMGIYQGSEYSSSMGNSNFILLTMLVYLTVASAESNGGLAIVLYLFYISFIAVASLLPIANRLPNQRLSIGELNRAYRAMSLLLLLITLLSGVYFGVYSSGRTTILERTNLQNSEKDLLENIERYSIQMNAKADSVERYSEILGELRDRCGEIYEEARERKSERYWHFGFIEMISGITAFSLLRWCPRSKKRDLGK
jgi:hypothetical protein